MYNKLMERIDDLQFENLKIIQNTDGFCFGVDSVLLTEFARDIRKNSKIADLGTGTGILGILLSKKVLPSEIVGVELQKEVAEMADRSIKLNNLENVFTIINDDVKSVGNLKEYKKYFDVVVTNPPYKKLGTGINTENEKQQISRYESTATLDNWISSASKILKDNGSFYMVYRTDRLTELIEILRKNKLEVKRMRFVYSKVDSQSNLLMLKAVRNANTFMKVEKPLIIYNKDGSYTDEIMNIYKIK